MIGGFHDAEKMLGLADGIGRIGEMIGAPEKAGARRLAFAGGRNRRRERDGG